MTATLPLHLSATLHITEEATWHNGTENERQYEAKKPTEAMSDAVTLQYERSPPLRCVMFHYGNTTPP